MNRTSVFKCLMRGMGWIIALTASTVIALNIEHVVVAHKLDELLPDPGKASGLMEIAQRPLVVVVAALILGVLIGIVAAKAKASLSKRFGKAIDDGEGLGSRMLMIAQNLSEVRRFAFSISDQDRRNATAMLNIALVDAHRLGLYTPQQSDPEVLLNYLTEVGSWLMKGDKEIAKVRAKIISGDGGNPGA